MMRMAGRGAELCWWLRSHVRSSQEVARVDEVAAERRGREVAKAMAAGQGVITFQTLKGKKAAKYASPKAAPYWLSSGTCQTAGHGSILPVMAEFPPSYIGVTSESFSESLERFIKTNAGVLLHVCSCPPELTGRDERVQSAGR